ncbi:MAG: DUF444 family protein, partial [Hyphomicrobiaceae bacterium]
RFFMLLHLFLTRHYAEVQVVFIRHTTEAQEVDEETFFKSTETGGTIISTALVEMMKIVKDRFSPADWNIYAAQASDGHNFDDDMERCLELLEGEILPCCQYYAYIEVGQDEGMQGLSSVAWSGYEEVAERNDIFAMRKVSSPGDIYPVFRELFATSSEMRGQGG